MSAEIVRLSLCRKMWWGSSETADSVRENAGAYCPAAGAATVLRTTKATSDRIFTGFPEKRPWSRLMSIYEVLAPISVKSCRPVVKAHDGYILRNAQSPLPETAEHFYSQPVVAAEYGSDLSVPNLCGQRVIIYIHDQAFL